MREIESRDPAILRGLRVAPLDYRLILVSIQSLNYTIGRKRAMLPSRNRMVRRPAVLRIPEVGWTLNVSHDCCFDRSYMDPNLGAFYVTLIVIIAIVAVKDESGGNRTSETANKVIDTLKALMAKITKK